MIKMNYAQSTDYSKAQAVLFGVDTRCAGTAPTFVTYTKKREFSADFIRNVDNRLFSLPENFKSGDLLIDQGNLDIQTHTIDGEINSVFERYSQVLSDKKIPICLGGDHIIKYAALKALDAMHAGEFGVIYLDAHPDCEALDVICYSSILHHGFKLPSLVPQQIMLLGIRQFTPNEVAALSTYQPEIGTIMGSELVADKLDLIVEKIVNQFAGLKYLYFSIDLDGLDPASAPAVESPYPGGPSVNQVLYLIQKLRTHFDYIGMDISEFIGELDSNHLTALAAARLVKEFYSYL